MNLGQELSQIRKDKGITQRWLTEQLQRHIPTMTEDKLSRRFLGKIDITGEELILIGKYLGIDLNELKTKFEEK
jgi:transcriptional regulator with XRE-family HTH domain